MRLSALQVKDLFKTIMINEKSVEELYLPELFDIKSMCETVIELADEQIEKYKNAPVGNISKWSSETSIKAMKAGDGNES